VLDNHCADYHTGRLVAGTFEVVVQTGVVYLLQLRPRKSVAKYNPAVKELHVDDEEKSSLCLNVDWIFCVEPNQPHRGSVIRFAIEKFIDSSRNAGTQISTISC
jgi:hypothetical protein